MIRAARRREFLHHGERASERGALELPLALAARAVTTAGNAERDQLRGKLCLGEVANEPPVQRDQRIDVELIMAITRAAPRPARLTLKK